MLDPAQWWLAHTHAKPTAGNRRRILKQHDEPRRILRLALPPTSAPAIGGEDSHRKRPRPPSSARRRRVRCMMTGGLRVARV
jgi:hypothetical protein